jgi:hypothetical protein
VFAETALKVLHRREGASQEDYMRRRGSAETGHALSRGTRIDITRLNRLA